MRTKIQLTLVKPEEILSGRTKVQSPPMNFRMTYNSVTLAGHEVIA